MKPKILFTLNAVPFLLEALNKTVNKDGYIIEKETGELVKTKEGDSILAIELGGIYMNSFYKKDLYSIMQLSESYANGKQK